MTDLSKFNADAVARIVGKLEDDERFALVATAVKQNGVTQVQAAVMVRLKDKWELRGFVEDTSSTPLTAGAELRFAW
jgi:hypothetical protein